MQEPSHSSLTSSSSHGRAAGGGCGAKAGAAVGEGAGAPTGEERSTVSGVSTEVVPGVSGIGMSGLSIDASGPPRGVFQGFGVEAEVSTAEGPPPEAVGVAHGKLDCG